MANKDQAGNSGQSATIGGGFKKVLYTLNTARRIGLKNSQRALTANNTCKACGLGMGGQAGGMTNELGEFPAVCNKSVQAQSTDIQPPVPMEVFNHTLEELRELSAREVEHLGRLATPLHKAKNSKTFKPVTWEQALKLAAEKFAATSPDRSFFYSSGRSSNEAGFLLQLLARMYGTNNVSNCSYYCHQATSVGLGSSIGSGTATVELADLELCDTIFVIGANPASNHPRFIHQLKRCRDRGGEVIVINPAREPGLVRFAIPKNPKSLLTGGDWIASEYVQPRIGTDIVLFKGLAKALIANECFDHAFIEQYTEGFGDFVADIQALDWQDITRHCGVERESIEQLARVYARSENTVFAWGMGMTHHQHGVENVEYIANLALMRGMIGRPGAGLLPLRGHSNVQGIGTVGVKPVLAEDVFDAMEASFGIKLNRQAGQDTLASLQAASRGEIDVALFMGGNLFAASPDTKWVTEALDNIGFKLYLTTTLNLGHIHGLDNSEAMILPVTARDEEWEPTTQESMFNYVRLSDGGINRLDNIRPETHILADFASNLLGNEPVDFRQFRSHHYCRQAIASIVPGMKGLADIDIAKREFHITGRLKHKPEFNMPDGKAVFNTRPIPLDYPGFVLSTIRSEGQFNSMIYEEHDSYRDVSSRWSVLVSPKDIEKLGLQAGDKVDLKSPYGQMNQVNVSAFDLPEGNIMAYFPEANVLVGQEVDPRSKTPAFKSVPVEITPVGA